MQVLKNVRGSALILLIGGMSQACQDGPLVVNCPDAGATAGGPALIVRVFDSAGNPAALGTTVTLDGPGDAMFVTGTDPDASVIEVGGRAGRFELSITRPWWDGPRPREIRIPTPEDVCEGFETTQVFATLTLQPDAPAIRQVVPEATHVSVSSDPPLTRGRVFTGRVMRAFIEGDPTVSTALEWYATEPEIADITPEGRLTATCRKTPIDTWIGVRTTTDPELEARVRVTVDATRLLTCP